MAGTGEALAVAPGAQVIPMPGLEEATQPTLEVPIQTFGFTFPEEPLLINGKTYAIRVNEANLVEWSDTLHDSAIIPNADGVHATPSSATVEYGTSLPASLGADSDPSQIYDPETNRMTLTVSRHINEDGKNSKDLVPVVEKALNRQFRKGYLENLGIATKETRSWRLGIANVFVTAPALGTAFGLATEKLDWNPDSRAVMGLGIFVVAEIAALVTRINQKGGITEKGMKWGQQKAANMGRYALFRGMVAEKPILSVKPIRQRKTTATADG